MKREGVWYFHKLVKGKREFNGRKTPFSLETRELEVAKAKRDAVLKAASGAEVDRILGRSQRPAASLGEIFAVYRRAPAVRANAETRERNIEDLRRLVRVVLGGNFPVDEASSALLGKQLVKDWQRARLETARAEQGGDLAALEATKRAVNSVLTHVQSIFSREARDDYDRLHLPPNIAEFMAALPLPARKQDEPVPLGDDLVGQLMAELPALRAADAGAWAAFQLMVWGGLRNKECVHARKGWLQPVPAGYKLTLRPTEDFLPKGNSRAPILPAPIVEGLLAVLPEDDDHLVPASGAADRNDAAYRRLNAWLKARGIAHEAGKIAYRLRKYFLKKVEEQQGLIFAQVAAGHSSLATLQDHYTGKPKMREPIRLG